ncbi:MAG: MFS transporter [Anaerolineae bacterium]|nr:MFS transporter [Anaerolineae bacterium]
MAIKGSNPAIKAFYQLLGNTIVAGITNNTVWFALIFYTYLETRSVIATSVVSGIYLVASAVSGVWFGGLVDRYQKKRALVGSGMASLVFYALGLAVFLAAPEGAFTAPTSVRLWVLVVLLLLGVIAGNVRGIALPTIVTLLIPENKRDRANGLAGTATGIAFVITSAISGVLVGSSGMVGVLILAMVLMATSVLHLLRLPMPEQEPARKDGKPAALDVRGTVAIIAAVPGLLALIGFTTLNNLLGGVFMGLMDAYGLSLVSVQIWGILWAFLSLGFIIGGLAIARWGLGKNPLAAMFAANLVIWTVSSLFTIQPSIVMLTAGMFVYLCVVPFIEAAEHTIMQRVVPQERQGRAFGFAHSVESAASPVTTLLIGPVAELVAIPFMTNGVGADLIGGWFGTGADRGIALVFTLTGIIGLVVTLVMMNTRAYRLLSACYMGTAIRRSRRGTIATVDLRACSAGAE